MMNYFNTFNALNDAFGISTQSFNAFAQAVLSIDWDETFVADDEMYFVAGDFVLTTPSLDPFACDWNPTVMYTSADGEVVYGTIAGFQGKLESVA